MRWREVKRNDNMATRKTDPTKKKKNGKSNGNGSKKKKVTSTAKKRDTTSTPTSRNKARRKAYLDRAYKAGIDTTKVTVKGKRGRIKEVGASTKRIAKKGKPEVRAHYKNIKGGVTRTSVRDRLHRDLSRGYKVEPTKKKKVTKKKR